VSFITFILYYLSKWVSFITFLSKWYQSGIKVGVLYYLSIKVGVLYYLYYLLLPFITFYYLITFFTGLVHKLGQDFELPGILYLKSTFYGKASRTRSSVGRSYEQGLFAGFSRSQSSPRQRMFSIHTVAIFSRPHARRFYIVFQKKILELRDRNPFISKDHFRSACQSYFLEIYSSPKPIVVDMC
jgi:hypothetical protein